ncbi:MAG: porin [Candidatus Nealsonbacteria bacterium]|nr:porin [Candidatus Nealsonbacteria bacterium]
MTIRVSIVVGSMLGLSMIGLGQADAADLLQPASVQQVTYELDNSLYFTAEGESPSDASIMDKGACDGCGACDACAPKCCPAAPGITIGGWMAMGYTANGFNAQNPPAGGGNGPVTFNYRANDFQLNQLNLFMERATETGGNGWDLGGRIDLLFGEDYIFTQAAGLETRPNWDNAWNVGVGGAGIGGTGRYGLAMPQFYGEVAYNDLKVKVGHFYTIIGYEVVSAPSNFFYSHSYTMQYGEPFTHTGAIATWEYAERLTLIAGIVNGWDKFDAVNDRGSFVGGFSWTSPSERASLALSFITGEEDGAVAILGNRTMYSLVFSLDVTDDWQYVLQHDLGVQENGIAAGQDAGWYGLNQYLFYTLSDTWAAGFRYEFFIDQNGTRVTNVPGDWQEFAVGLNWSPNDYMVLRPELRWDRFNPSGAGAAAGPFNDATDRDQFLFGIDLILTL